MRLRSLNWKWNALGFYDYALVCFSSYVSNLQSSKETSHKWGLVAM